MGTIETIKLIAELGFLVVASGLFIYLAYKMFNKQQDWLEQFVKGTISSTKHPDEDTVDALAVINNKIYQEVRGVLNALKADRVYVALYHNGGTSSSGLYFQKMSCICEVVSQGILPMSSSCQNLHQSSYMLFIDKLKEKSEILLSDTQTLKGIDNFLYQELVSRHAQSAYFRALKDSNDRVVGFLGVDYCSLNEEVSEEQISKLMKVVGLKISGLVDIRDEVK